MVINSAVDADRLFDFIRANDLQPKIQPVIACGRAVGREKFFGTYVDIMKRHLERSLDADSPGIIQPLDEIIDAILGFAPIKECSFNGSLRDHSLLELYRSANAERIRARQQYLAARDCKGCCDWALCHGGCSFEAVNAFGTLEAKYSGFSARKEFMT